MTKREMLDKRQGEDQAIAARTLDRALAWLVEKGDVGEKQLMNKPGKRKVYWLGYKALGDSGEKEKTHSRQTPSYSKEFGENEPEDESEGSNVLLSEEGL